MTPTDRPLARWLAFATTVLCIASVALAQSDWIHRLPTTSPSPRQAHAMAYDAARATTVAFGGSDVISGPFGDTWLWNGTNWSQSTEPGGPSARDLTAMAYDPIRERVVLFGGCNQPTSPCAMNDTWEWDGIRWTLANDGSSASPPARYSHAMAFDPVRARVILFGGSNCDSGSCIYYGDTWEWDGATWSALPGGPSARVGHALATDTARGRVVLFGGVGSGYLSDTWEWDGTQWIARTPVGHPTPRFAHQMAYDSIRGRVFLNGGGHGAETYGDSFEYDGNTWVIVRILPVPPSRRDGGFVYDSGRGRLVLFGGLHAAGRIVYDDTWELPSLPLAIETVTPSAGLETGGEVVTIRGYGFRGTTALTFGGAAATLDSIANEVIQARTPAGIGPVDVTITGALGTFTAPGAYSFVPPEILARLGNVNLGRGDRENVLTINASAGDAVREVSVGIGQPLSIAMATPSTRTSSAYALYVWPLAPSAAHRTEQPFGLGTTIFPTPLNVGALPQPVFLWNNLGHVSRLGVPSLASSPAPAVVLNRPQGVPAARTVSLQGFIRDDGSMIPQGVSITNAIVLRVH